VKPSLGVGGARHANDRMEQQALFLICFFIDLPVVVANIALTVKTYCEYCELSSYLPH
jgi:hypothetical protein